MADQSDEMNLRNILTSNTVGELMRETVAILSSTDSVADAAAKMRSQSHGSALVCAEGELAGIFTERDLLGVIASKRSLETSLAEAMTTRPQTVNTNDSLFDAMRWMDEGGCRRLPVVDAAGAPVGVVDVKTITHFLVEHFPEGVYNQASYAQSIAKHREGA